MDKERFEYLYNTLPWNLKPEDVQEAKELHDRLRPVLFQFFMSKFDDTENLEMCSVCGCEPVIEASYKLHTAYTAAFCDCGESLRTTFDAVEGLSSKTPRVDASNITFDKWNKKHRTSNNGT